MNKPKNMFKEKKETYILKDIDFPDLLIKKTSNILKHSPTKMNYALASEIVEKIEEKDDLEPGWERFIFTRQIKEENPPNETHIEYNNRVNNMISEMGSRWEKYKEIFIEIYGEDEYYKTHPILNDNFEEEYEEEYETFEDYEEEYEYYK